MRGDRFTFELHSSELVSRNSTRVPVVVLYDRGGIESGYIKVIRSLSSWEVPVLCVPAVQKIEVWLIADIKALYSAFGTGHNGPLSPMDRVDGPKRFFLHFCWLAIRKIKRWVFQRSRTSFGLLTEERNLSGLVRTMNHWRKSVKVSAGSSVRKGPA